MGLGTALGNGCTSGHGICGNARLSVRSLAYTLTFMAAGAAAATAFGTMSVLGIAPVAPAYLPLSQSELQTGLALAGAGSAVLGLLVAVGRSMAPGSSARSKLELLTSASVGALFAAGLVVSGMTHPSKVCAFVPVLVCTAAVGPAMCFGGRGRGSGYEAWGQRHGFLAQRGSHILWLCARYLRLLLTSPSCSSSPHLLLFHLLAAPALSAAPRRLLPS